MELHQAIELFQSQVSNMDSLWAYYSSAALAVLGFTVASEKATRSRHEISAIQIGFFLFSVGNCIAISGSQTTLIELSDLIKKAGGSESLANVFSVEAVVSFQVVVTVTILAVIEVTYRHNKPSQQDAQKTRTLA